MIGSFHTEYALIECNLNKYTSQGTFKCIDFHNVLIFKWFIFRYFIFDFDASPNSVKLIMSKIRSNKDVIRANVVKADTP